MQSGRPFGSAALLSRLICVCVCTQELEMPTKTISVDIEAYDRLKSVQKENESFSQTIKRVIRKPFNYNAWLKAMERDPMSEEAVEAVEQVIASRRAPQNVASPQRSK